MKITTAKRVKKSDVIAECVTIDILVDFLTKSYIDEGKGNAKVRANLPGRGWVYFTDVSDVFGEPYIGLALAEAEEMQLKEKEIEEPKKEYK